MCNLFVMQKNRKVPVQKCIQLLYSKYGQNKKSIYQNLFIGNVTIFKFNMGIE